MQDGVSLPMDVWEYTVDFLWYDPPSLLACALACRAWARRSRFLLQRETTLTIRSAKDMRMYGHLLASKRSRKLFAKIRILRIIDDPTSPFVHTLPLILPGQHLPEVATVVLENINWTISSPHITFFRKLSQFAELTSICLHRCILRPVSHAMRLLRTLPRLQSAVEGQRGAACLPRDAVSFDCVLIGTEIDVESHQHMHPGVKHKTLQQGEVHPRLSARIGSHIAQVLIHTQRSRPVFGPTPYVPVHYRLRRFKRLPRYWPRDVRTAPLLVSGKSPRTRETDARHHAKRTHVTFKSPWSPWWACSHALHAFC